MIGVLWKSSIKGMDVLRTNLTFFIVIIQNHPVLSNFKGLCKDNPSRDCVRLNPNMGGSKEFESRRESLVALKTWERTGKLCFIVTQFSYIVVISIILMTRINIDRNLIAIEKIFADARDNNSKLSKFARMQNIRCLLLIAKLNQNPVPVLQT